MPVDYTRDNTGKITSGNVKSDLTDEDLKKREDAAKFGSTAGAGLGAKGKAPTTGFPKQEQGESAMSYGERLRQYRASQSSSVEGQRKALKAMGGG